MRRLLFTICILLSNPLAAAPDPNFHIYLMFGQSNMEGAAPIEPQDRVINQRVKVMANLDCSNLGRIYGNWYVASPPLNRCWSGLGPGDYFGKAMADSMPSNVTIGLVPAAITGTPIELYQKSAPIGRNDQEFPTSFSGGYAWLLDMAKKAQKAGVIKGIIFHQGESDTADPMWKHQVQEIVTDLRQDLGIGDVPFLAGELLYAEYQSCCHWHNNEINLLPGLINNAHVVSAVGLPGLDAAHFTSESYRELGYRYAILMLEKLEIPFSSSSSSSSSSSVSSGVNSNSGSGGGSMHGLPFITLLFLIVFSRLGFARMATNFLEIFRCVAFLWGLAVTPLCAAKELAITFDDAPTPDSALMSGDERTQRIIATLHKARVPDALFFVQADRINKDTQTRLDQYAAAGFHVANHSYSHQSASALGKDGYIADVKAAHLLLRRQKNFLSFHRFPYLDCGKDESSVLAIRESLNELGYKDGYITIANYDWHINNLLDKAVENNQNIDYEKAKQFYVDTLFSAIEFYDEVAIQALGRSPKHVLLLHENDAAALFLGDLIAHLRNRGWKIISPQDAYEDPISRDLTNISYHHQNRISAIARHSGVKEKELYHVSENVDYLDEAFNAAGFLF